MMNNALRLSRTLRPVLSSNTPRVLPQLNTITRQFGSHNVPAAAIRYRKNGYAYIADDPDMHIHRNPYVEGVAHYRDQIHEDTQSLSSRDYVMMFVMLVAFPGMVLYGYKVEQQRRYAQHGVVQALFPDPIPEGGDAQHR